MFNVQYSMFDPIVFSVQCSVFNVQCSMFDVQCLMHQPFCVFSPHKLKSLLVGPLQNMGFGLTGGGTAAQAVVASYRRVRLLTTS